MKVVAALVMLLAMQQSPYMESIEVRIHNVDVIVTDANGNHVGGLREEDFELLEDGQAQAISNFAEYADRSAAPAAGAKAQTPPPRKYVVFVDEMSMHPYTRKKFAKSVNDLLDRTMRDGDQAAVLMPATADKVTLEFTADRAKVRADVAAAMDASRFRANSPLELERRAYAIDRSGSGSTRNAERYLARRHAERMRERVEQRLGNLRAVVSGLAGQEGRKVIMLVTESLPAQPGAELFRFLSYADSKATAVPVAFNKELAKAVSDYADLRPVLDEIARSASANGITIYGLQPELGTDLLRAPGEIREGGSLVGSATGFDQSLDELGITGDQLTAYDALRNTEASLDILTEKTGGKWFRGDTRVDDAFRQVEFDVSSYYSMAYRAEGSLDRPHTITVRVKGRPELNVRARNEVVRRSIRNEVTERVVASLVKSEARNELGIAVEKMDVDRESRNAIAELDVLVPLDKLTFLPEGDMQKARFTVHYAVSGERVDFVSGVEPEQVVEIPAAELADARNKHWRYTLKMNMRKAAHRVGIGVLDGTSQEWGVATVEVDTR